MQEGQSQTPSPNRSQQSYGTTNNQYSSEQDIPHYEEGENYQEYERGYNRDYEYRTTYPGSLSYSNEGEKLRPRPAQGRKNNKTWLWFVGGIVVIGLLFFGGAAKFWYSQYAPIDKASSAPYATGNEFKVADHAMIVINALDSNVHIHVGNNNEVLLQGDQGDGSSVNAKATVSGGEADIEISPAASQNVDVAVPADSSLEIHTASGNADVHGIAGSVAFDSQSGSFTLDQTTVDQGSISVQTLSGNIDLNDVNLGGQSSLNTGSGHVIVHGTIVAGTTHIETASGDVTLRLLQDFPTEISVHTETVTGKVVNDFSGNGDNNNEDLSIHTLSGNIEVTKG